MPREPLGEAEGTAGHPPAPPAVTLYVMNVRFRLLGEILVDRGAITAPARDRALDDQARTGDRLGAVLLRGQAISEKSLAGALAEQMGLELAPPPLKASAEGLELIGMETAREREVVPLDLRERVLQVALSDPVDGRLVDDLTFRTGRRVEILVATPTEILAALDRASGAELAILVRDLPADLIAVRDTDPHALEMAARAAPVVRLVDRLIQLAAVRGASDLHLDGAASQLDARLRIDGVLRTEISLPAGIRSALVSRLKVMAGLDISVKRRPQDGGFTVPWEGRELTIRMSSVPVQGGEKVVLRLLDPANVPLGLDALGFGPEALERVRALTRARQGVVLVAGPTGSGKSSTLFGAVSELDRTRLNVITLEDPIEYRAAGVTQIQVDARSGLGFPAALRAILRQDPDVIMVGEIRDRETAEIAMAAAITGHLVVSTIHTPDAPSALDRLAQMGVPRYLIAGGVSGVVAQRLLRALCRRCLGASDGCVECLDGYRGRTGVFEVLTMNDRLREEVVRESPPMILRRLAIDGGMVPMIDDARRKIAEGITTPHEIARVLRDALGSVAPCRSAASRYRSRRWGARCAAPVERGYAGALADSDPNGASVRGASAERRPDPIAWVACGSSAPLPSRAWPERPSRRTTRTHVRDSSGANLHGDPELPRSGLPRPSGYRNHPVDGHPGGCGAGLPSGRGRLRNRRAMERGRGVGIRPL